MNSAGSSLSFDGSWLWIETTTNSAPLRAARIWREHVLLITRVNVKSMWVWSPFRMRVPNIVSSCSPAGGPALQRATDWASV